MTLSGETLHDAHDLVLRLPNCPDSVVLTFGDDDSLGAEGLPVKKDEEFRRFLKYVNAGRLSIHKTPSQVTYCHECWIYHVTAKLSGRLDVVRRAGLKRDDAGKIIGSEGFGHPIPFTRYRLVVTTISGVKATRLSSPQAAQ